jgi:hypothetical protein
MPEQLAALIDEAARWGPVLPVALMFAVALLEALVLPSRLWMKGACAVAVVISGLGAAELLRWQQHTTLMATSVAATDRTAAETAALRGLWSQWDTLSRSLPSGPREQPAASFDSVENALASLSAKVARVGEQIAALKEARRERSVDAETAVKLADYLRQYGSYRVVVSCVSGDDEAYTYANQLANILRAAGWDSNGPEATAFAEATGMGISLYIRDPGAPGAAKILVDAFTRFNIPYQPAIGTSDAIPDTATVELFVAKKP